MVEHCTCNAKVPSSILGFGLPFFFFFFCLRLLRCAPSGTVGHKGAVACGAGNNARTHPCTSACSTAAMHCPRVHCAHAPTTGPCCSCPCCDTRFRTHRAVGIERLGVQLTRIVHPLSAPGAIHSRHQQQHGWWVQLFRITRALTSKCDKDKLAASSYLETTKAVLAGASGTFWRGMLLDLALIAAKNGRSFGACCALLAPI